MVKKSKEDSFRSYSFYSFPLTEVKYKALMEKALLVRDFKNEISKLISNNIENYFVFNKYETDKIFNTNKVEYRPYGSRNEEEVLKKKKEIEELKIKAKPFLGKINMDKYSVLSTKDKQCAIYQLYDLIHNRKDQLIFAFSSIREFLLSKEVKMKNGITFKEYLIKKHDIKANTKKELMKQLRTKAGEISSMIPFLIINKDECKHKNLAKLEEVYSRKLLDSLTNLYYKKGVIKRFKEQLTVN